MWSPFSVLCLINCTVVVNIVVLYFKDNQSDTKPYTKPYLKKRWSFMRNVFGSY